MLIFKKFLRDLPAVIGVIIVLAIVILSMTAQWVAPYPEDATATYPLRRLRPPSWEHWFGTDHIGRDILSRVILGTQNALGAALAVILVAGFIGVTAGLVAGYTRGWVSETIMRITDVFLAVPQLLLALSLSQLLSPGRTSAMIALTVTYWPFFTRLVFTETRRLTKSMFIDALQCLGAGRVRIVFRHILPNILSPIIVRASIGMGLTILVSSALAFIGVGASPPDPDWGLAISEARQYLPEAWWFATFPGLAILIAVLGFNLIGDGLRDLVDPRLRRSR